MTCTKSRGGDREDSNSLRDGTESLGFGWLISALKINSFLPNDLGFSFSSASSKVFLVSSLPPGV